jgi:BlaI family transcriptional regulator, penicillinase repressor
MARARREIPPPLELLCLRALWLLQEGAVKDVQRIVAQSRPLAYTTIMTVLERLARKGKIGRRKLGRAFLYAPHASQDSLRREAVRELLDGFFNGSAEDLMRFLRENPPHKSEPATMVAGEGGAARIAALPGNGDRIGSAPIDPVLL